MHNQKDQRGWPFVQKFGYQQKDKQFNSRGNKHALRLFFLFLLLFYLYKNILPTFNSLIPRNPFLIISWNKHDHISWFKWFPFKSQNNTSSRKYFTFRLESGFPEAPTDSTTSILFFWVPKRRAAPCES